MSQHGMQIVFMGGETADVGDVVRTITVNGTMTARWPKEKIITNEKIKAGNVIVGFASYGQSVYEKEYNSGIGSNGLTSARHDVLKKKYKQSFPESLDGILGEDVSYIGPYDLADTIDINYRGKHFQTSIGKLILSPTRTFLPVVKHILLEHFDAVNGMIHCSGGGQTKCMKYVPDTVNIIKDNLFEPPEIFRIIQHSSGADDKEMYQVFNMGCRLEIYAEEKYADSLIGIAKDFGVEAQVIGRVEAGNKSLRVKTKRGEIVY
jgi:phosphoribosylformylglycinamidine cyclo-ligase